MARVHVIGAGLAGLSAAVRLVSSGAQVILHEQAGQAGGRARSFHDALLDTEIDNGNHLLLSGNHSTMEYLQIVGARQRLIGPGSARFDFFDMETNDRWSIDLNRGPVPLWVLYKDKRVLGTSMADYLSGLKLLTAGERSVKQLFGDQGQMYRRFWEPFSIGVLNTPAEVAVARLLMPVIRETLARGADYSQPMIARKGLSDTFVAPALAWLERNGADVRFGDRVLGLDMDARQVTRLKTSRGDSTLGSGDAVVLAVPAWAAGQLVKGIEAPNSFAPIVNVHFRVENAEGRMAEHRMLGLVGSATQWLFTRGEIVSVTISAAMPIVDMPGDAIVNLVWPEVAAALGARDLPQPPARVIKERRATFMATPEQLERRPSTRTAWRNLVLAGDWIDTGLPATIEGTIRSGQRASEALASQGA